MAMPANIVLPWVASLRAPHGIYVESPKIASCQSQVENEGGGKLKRVSIVVVDQLVDEHMNKRNPLRYAKPSKHKRLILLVVTVVDPRE